jgi:hypothetical protein
LARAIREQQYQAVSSLYNNFGLLMGLYREINNSPTYPNDKTEWLSLLKRANEIEAMMDALLLRISCEFVTGSEDGLESMLGHMRQAVQTWRETIEDKKKLPFKYSHQKDYERFKETFAGVAAFMVHRIHYGLTPPKMRMDEAKSLLASIFSNKYEHLEYVPMQGKEQWVKDVVEQKRIKGNDA